MDRALAGWVEPVAAVVLLAGAVELLLPSSGARGYGRAVLGLLVLLTVLRPLLGWLDGGPQLTRFLDEAAQSVAGASSAPAAALLTSATAPTTQLVADLTTRLVRSEPGGTNAQVTVWFAPSGSGSVPRATGARVELAGPSSGAQRQAIADAVAAALGLQPSSVTVDA